MIPIPQINLASIGPELVLAAFAIGMIILDLTLPVKRKSVVGYVALGALLVAAIVAVRMWDKPYSAFSGMIVVDNYRIFFTLIFLLGTAFTILLSLRYLGEEGINRGEFYMLLIFATIGMTLMAGGSDLMIIFLGLETMSICVYVLTGFARRDVKSNESALKYFLLGAFATGFLVYGMALVYGATGTTNLGGISRALAEPEFANRYFMLAGIGLMVVGFGFKVAAVPFHMWTPDVYEGAPTSVTAFMSVGVKAAGFAGFSRVFIGSLGGIHADWTMVLWVLAVATMFMGNIVAIAQTNMKRLLAFSSIAHAGYLLMALVAGNDLAKSGLLYYLLAYAFMNFAAFAVVIVLEQREKRSLQISNYQGLGYRYPLLGLVMALALISLAGIPPTAGFVGKFYIFSAAIREGYVVLAVLGVISTVISVYYYLRIIVYMYMQDETAELVPRTMSPGSAITLAVCAIGILYLGIFPRATFDLATKSIRLLLG